MPVTAGRVQLDFDLPELAGGLQLVGNRNAVVNDLDEKPAALVAYVYGPPGGGEAGHGL